MCYNTTMKKALSDIRGFLADLDGTTYVSHTPTPGAVEFFTDLQQKNIPYFFFSNNPTKNPAEYVTQLTHMGIPAAGEQIITSTDATVRHLKKLSLSRVYIIGTPSFEGVLADNGIQNTMENPEGLVISFDTALTYEKLRIATQMLRAQPNLPYIASNPDPICSPTDIGPLPDCGALIAFLHAATNRMPEVMGKPGPGMIEIACERSGLAPNEFAMIGDRFATDMQMGFNHNVTTILVLCGDTTAQDLATVSRQPDYVFPTLADLHAQLG